MPGSTTNPMANDTSNPTLVLRSGRVIPRMTDNEGHQPKSLTSDHDHKVAAPESPFLKLPAELRLQIYRYLLHAHRDVLIDLGYTLHPPAVLEKRGWQRFPSSGAAQNETALYKATAIDIHPAILSVNRQTYSEANRILYSENRFNFCGPRFPGNEHVIPFLESLSEESRRLIKQIEFVWVVMDWVPHYTGGTSITITERVFNETCDYLGPNLQLKHVVLRVLQYFGYGVIKPASFKDDLLALHGKTWEQHLVPLVRGLDAFELTTSVEDGPEAIDIVQEYLKSKIPRTSRPTFSTRTY
ncbi:hypothetical protein BDR22DRAFT_823649 [Usnea florida]